MNGLKKLNDLLFPGAKTYEQVGAGKAVALGFQHAFAMSCAAILVPLLTGLDVGVALLAGVGAGVYGSVPEACAAVIKYGPAQQPDEERHRRYGEFYGLYRQLYPALKPLYAQLGTLT